MDLGIAGKTAVVMAASKGLGLATALSLGREGCNVVLSSRGGDALDAAAAQVMATGAAVEVVVADATEPDAPGRLVQAGLDRFGSLDIAVGNAGGPPAARALDVDDDTILAAVNLNMLASIRLVRAAVAPMRLSGWGRIALISSYTIRQPLPTLALSNTARTGLYAWAKTAAQDLFADGITLNMVGPGLHDTDRIRSLHGGSPPADAIGDPADFGEVVAFLCSRQAGFITGSAVIVDGGATVGL
jgi:3-oxoacyl-[acyl-carrier protein] reductase